MADYAATRARVEHYFDRTAARTWARLTSDAENVGRIRQTVREGRTTMRALMLSRLPDDMTGARVLDAGCGPGAMTADLAARGADVIAVDLAPNLIALAQSRLAPDLRHRVEFRAGDMTDPALGRFDAVIAMDSLIYYSEPDLAAALDGLGRRCAGPVVFTVAPRTPLLMAMFTLGKAFPRGQRSPRMVPHHAGRLNRRLAGRVGHVGRVARGFYISDCLELGQ